MKRKKWLNVILEEFVKLNNYGKIKNRHCCSVTFFCSTKTDSKSILANKIGASFQIVFIPGWSARRTSG